MARARTSLAISPILDHRGLPMRASGLSGSPYEGASTGRRMIRWGLSSSGPNASIFGSLTSLRSRSRELVRNDPHASNAVETFVSETIGHGVFPRWHLDDAGQQREIQALWDDWIMEADADGRVSFYGLQALAMRSMVESGEVLIRFRPRYLSEGLSVPFQLQVMEGDHLDESFNDVKEGGNEIRMGVEFNRIGRRVAYHLWRNHPGDMFPFSANTERVPVPASEMLHIYRALRPGQIRGLPILTPIIVALHDISQAKDAELVRIKTQAMFGGFLKTPGEEPYSQVLGREIENDRNENTVLSLEPGSFPELPPGVDVVFSEPKAVAGAYNEWMRQQLHDAAVGVGLSYEQFSGDLSKVNFSSIRAGVQKIQRWLMTIQIHTIAFQLCRPVARYFLDTAVASGVVRLRDYLDNPRKYLRIDWLPDGWDYVNPLQDVQADVLRVRAGFNSRAQIIAKRGGDIETVDREIAEENRRADELGFSFETDPRRENPMTVIGDIERRESS